MQQFFSSSISCMLWWRLNFSFSLPTSKVISSCSISIHVSLVALEGVPIDDTCWSSSMPKVTKSIGKSNSSIPTKTFSIVFHGCYSSTCISSINSSSLLASSFFSPQPILGLGFPPQNSKAQSFILPCPYPLCRL